MLMRSRPSRGVARGVAQACNDEAARVRVWPCAGWSCEADRRVRIGPTLNITKPCPW